MCQGCVDEGRLTAAELAERLAAGDKGVVALATLEPADFLDEITQLCAAAILAGMPFGEAVQSMLDTVDSYIVARELNQQEMDKLRADLAGL